MDFLKTSKVVAILTTLLMLSGCVTYMKPVFRDQPVKTSEVNYKSYKLSVPVTASIGDVLIERKIYKERRIANAAARALQDMKIARATCMPVYGPCEEFLPADRDYEVQREVTYKGEHYFVVSTSRNKLSKLDATVYSENESPVLVKDTGEPLEQIFIPGSDYVISSKLIISPPGAKMKFVDRVERDTSSSFEERIVLSSVSKTTIGIRYSSRTYDDSGSPISREEEYQLPNTEKVTFKGYALKVIRSDQSSISYVLDSEPSNEPK